MTLKELRPNGATGGDLKDLLYREDLHGPHGCAYILLREEHHTDEDVKRAKGWLKYHHDVVSITVVKETHDSKNTAKPALFRQRKARADLRQEQETQIRDGRSQGDSADSPAPQRETKGLFQCRVEKH